MMSNWQPTPLSPARLYEKLMKFFNEKHVTFKNQIPVCPKSKLFQQNIFEIHSYFFKSAEFFLITFFFRSLSNNFYTKNNMNLFI